MRGSFPIPTGSQYGSWLPGHAGTVVAEGIAAAAIPASRNHVVRPGHPAATRACVTSCSSTLTACCPITSAATGVDRSQIGRHKVTALAARLTNRDALLRAEALPLDVIDDADPLRPVFADAAAIMVTSDGVESRRVANHLACQAEVPAVFACVLDNGRYGEVLRVVPRRTGCLLCTRAALAEAGGIDPEPSLDRGYGTGTRHLPMAAVGGDLGLVGELTAKSLVATLLERRGFRDQRLAGDHAIIALRPAPELAAPFDIELAGQVRWHPGAMPRPGCPSCGQT
jgi:hypothetical protein